MTYRARGRSIFEVVVVSDVSPGRTKHCLCCHEYNDNVVLSGFNNLCLVASLWIAVLYIRLKRKAHSLCYFTIAIKTQAVAFVVFLVGFITVLCIGNYFRAKRAQERQRQRRMAKLASAGNAQYSSDPSYAGSYEAPQPSGGVSA